MGDATWGGKAIPLGKRACGRGEAGKRCELGEATFRPRTKWGWRSAKTQEKEGIWLTVKYCTLWYSVHHNKQYLHLPNYARRGSHVQIHVAQPAPLVPGHGYHQAMLTLPRR